MEEHEFFFQGVWVPATVFNLLGDGEIDANDVVLLIVVDAYVAPEHGCLVNNKFLAKKTGLTQAQVQESVDRLTENGTLLVTQKGGKRQLETAWSRVL